MLLGLLVLLATLGACHHTLTDCLEVPVPVQPPALGPTIRHPLQHHLPLQRLAVRLTLQCSSSHAAACTRERKPQISLLRLPPRPVSTMPTSTSRVHKSPPPARSGSVAKLRQQPAMFARYRDHKKIEDGVEEVFCQDSKWRLRSSLCQPRHKH